MKRFLEYFRVTLITICFAAGFLLLLFSIIASFAFSSIYSVILGVMGGVMGWSLLQAGFALMELEEEKRMKELEEALQVLERKKTCRRIGRRRKVKRGNG